MRKNLQKLMLAGVLVTTTAYATEIRTPWLSSRGPIRYSFDKLHECSGNMNWWSAMHTKEANKAFLKHGTKSKELSALIFNQSTFTLDQTLPNSTVPLNSQNYNPFLSTTSVSPRVAYTEYGMTMGGSIDWPVWCNKGRIGLRVSIPFRRIEMERKDNDLCDAENPLDDLVKENVLKINRASDGVLDAASADDIVVKAYRMDLLTALRNANNSAIMVGDATGIKIFGTQIGGATPETSPTAITITDPANPGLNTPLNYAFQLSDGNNIGSSVSEFQAAAIVPIVTNTYAPLPVDATTVSYFAAGTSYLNTLGSQEFADNKATTWLIFRRQTDSPDPEDFGAGVANDAGLGGGVARGIDNLLQQFNENAFCFLQKQGFALDDTIRSGLGDIDLDLFYEHAFSDEWVGELAVGVRIPTGSGRDYYGNPFKMQLGNGEHWEIKLFGLMAWQALCWMNIKIDASYNFVLENTEHRMAAFKGATIKNFGPRADADVDWGYFIGHFDFNFTHPKTSKIRSMFGYEFVYKTKDHLTFKQSAMESFLGGSIVNGVLVANPQPLDNNLASKGTESIAHKVRCETSVDVNKYFEIFAGASTTFAGQNIMKDRDLHGGFNVRF